MARKDLNSIYYREYINEDLSPAAMYLHNHFGNKGRKPGFLPQGVL